MPVARHPLAAWVAGVCLSLTAAAWQTAMWY